MTQSIQNPASPIPDYLDSDHVSARTREVLTRRIGRSGAPEHLSARAYGVLTVVCTDVLPHDSVPETQGIDLAGLVDAALGGKRDGWRYAELPPDREAYEAGLLTLDDLAREQHGQDYAALPDTVREALLDAITRGDVGLERAGRLNTTQIRLWAADLRADIVTAFLSHPAAQEALGISAVMTGGDARFQGFSEVGPDRREAFEPRGVFAEARP